MDGQVTFRRAVRADVEGIVRLLADDELGAEREDPADLGPYHSAFADIDADPRHLLLVGDWDGEVVACVQAAVVPGLSRGGARRVQLEGVRVARDLRGRGVGGELIDQTLTWARRQGCTLAQLTTDRRRPSARRFYEDQGFVATHDGMKRPL